MQQITQIKLQFLKFSTESLIALSDVFLFTTKIFMKKKIKGIAKSNTLKELMIIHCDLTSEGLTKIFFFYVKIKNWLKF